jgi:hypothetical protein
MESLAFTMPTATLYHFRHSLTVTNISLAESVIALQCCDDSTAERLQKVGWWYWTDNQLGFAVGQGRIPANALQHYQRQGGILSARFLDFILFTLVFTGMTFYLSPQHHRQMTISVSRVSATQTRKFPSFREKGHDDLKKKFPHPVDH